ncbi:glycoside hydrolase family 28 protein [Algoriphagus sp. D3-2-R+10]|uniref:glycoside hydrolase family 28 protein n=1 Tax=Algoriphagus aurantiacus TaxID=3103948 RepID=UPI002B390454|nr:glycoside hydrolase family 28 protein [Algoriphagus sp. D3-2-R+10]MEB2777781.1 glycoside hydrolase family 28 protein [Algoriphagus sp. D3-2-R+10]
MKLNLLKAMFSLVMIVFAMPSFAQQTLESMYEGIEFDMPKVKETDFPDFEKSIIEYGAVGNGIIKNSEAFKAAIEEVSSKGGGKVLVPRGVWLTGPITLLSNVNLHLEDGALILFSTDFDDYPLIETSFEGLNTVRCISPINAYQVQNIAITGNGTIDGNGDAWRFVKKGKMTEGQWKTLVNSGGVLDEKGQIWFPTQASLDGYNASSSFNVPDTKDRAEMEKMKDFLRPVMVSIRESKRVLLDGPTFQNSPAWNIHPLMSEDVIIRNLNVRNPWYSQNGDGLDLESCKNVLIYNNTFDVGDDAMCFKSGKDNDGRDRGMPTENVIVKNNIVYHAHGGFVVGSEMSGGVRNVHVSDCTFIGTDVGLRFKSTRGRGGIVENIWISNIHMIDIPAEAIRFNMFYSGNSPILEDDQSADDEARDEVLVPVNEETPSFQNISMKNIYVSGSGIAGFFMGLPEMKLKNVSLENSVLEAEKGITAIDASGLILRNVKVLGTKDASLTIYNSDGVSVSGFSFEENGKAPVRVLGSKTSDLTFDKKDFKSAGEISYGNGASESAVKLK